MKKNITINLCGRLFNIDEDAYELLNNYTTTLRNYFKKQEEGEEIANDIEERIAELFAEVKNQGHEAICIENVQDVIKRIGAVENIAPGADGFDNSSDSSFSEKMNGAASSIGERVSDWFDGLKRKRFYRDSKDKMLGGVLSGCSKFFGGNVIIWRLVYVFLSIGTIKALFALPIMLLAVFHANFAFIPFMLIAGLGALLLNSAPVVIYAIAYFLLPEVKSPEDSLRMKGKDVTPQNLGDEVAGAVREDRQEALQSHSAAKGCLNGFFSFLAVCVKFFIWCVGILMFIPCIFSFVVMVIGYFLPEDISKWMFGRFGYEIYQQMPEYFWLFGVCAFAVSFIPAYCSLHWLLCFFDKVKPMSIYQRILWFGLWIFAIIGVVGSFVKIEKPRKQLYAEYYTKGRFEVNESMKARHEHDGFEFRDIDWEYFQDNGFKLLKAENCSENRYTYSGEYYNGDDEVRYLDAFSWDCDIVYQAEKCDSIQPGKYMLSALARCSDNSRGVFIYAYLAADTVVYTKYLAEVPCYGNKKPDGANPDKVLDYGWVKVSTDVIEVKTPSLIHYGVSTDEDFTGKICTAQWFSATDFVLEKMEEVKNENEEKNKEKRIKQKKS